MTIRNTKTKIMKEFKGDKRTKEYQEWKSNFENQKGLGDKIEEFTEATGIKALVKSIAGDDCGCDERKEKLNEMFRSKVNCPTEDEWQYLNQIFKTKPKLTGSIQKRMREIYERIFNKSLVSSCLSCSFVTTIYNPLKRLYDASL